MIYTTAVVARRRKELDEVRAEEKTAREVCERVREREREGADARERERMFV